MRREIVLAPTAVGELRDLPAGDRARVRDAIERHLRHEPTRVSRSRIKRLRGMMQPQFRLRVAGIRVFYDVTENRVEILAIVPKSRAESWLREKGKTHEEGGPGEDQR
ncbi:MAG: type II toxin-antitoxin system RelE/ParE family toxin [Planctomycetes bacterium]|nr:type II toxin-antitoxin system RelE/ParE family toxin [Planctomycetota bacterium]